MTSLLERFRPLFHPESVAVIGASATPQKWGFGILHNLVQGRFKGPVYPINPKQKEIFGIPAFPSVEETPGKVDLAILAIPPEKVLQAVESCGRKGVRALVIITAGFGETGHEGRELQDKIAQTIKRYDMIAIGPNCQGIMCTQARLFGQFIWIFPGTGKISMVSQSGNVGASLIGRAMAYGTGFSKFVSSGNEAVTKCWELIEYFGEDPETEVIAAYIEGVSDGRAFVDALKKVTPRKPVVILKGGVTDAGSSACASHTGALAGSIETFNAACEQAGAVIVNTLDDLFYAVATFASQPLPRGRRVGIVTWGGGWGVLAADACVRENLVMPPLPEELVKEMSGYLASRWSHNNPVDLAATQSREALMRSVELLVRSDAFDAVIQLGIGVSTFFKRMVNNSFFFKAPERMEAMEAAVVAAENMDRRFCEKVMSLSRETGKPILPSSDTSSTPSEDNIALNTLKREGRLIYPTPFHAARALGLLARYADFKKRLT